jgi:hypothetical protein
MLDRSGRGDDGGVWGLVAKERVRLASNAQQFTKLSRREELQSIGDERLNRQVPITITRKCYGPGEKEGISRKPTRGLREEKVLRRLGNYLLR